jgi:hypothetical protein
VDLIESLQGAGTLNVRGCRACWAKYVISYWRHSARKELVGVGHLSAELSAVQAAARGQRAWLLLSDGRRVDLTFRRRGVGTDWGEIDASEPIWPTPAANVYSLIHERNRRAQG